MVSNKTAHKRLLLFLCLTLLCALLATAVCTAAEAAPANPADGTEAEAGTETVSGTDTSAEAEPAAQSSGFTGRIKTFFLETVGKRWCVFFCSMIPIIELRGAIPMGAAFGLPWWQTFLISVAGNMLPVPFILLFIGAILRWMAGCRVKLFNRFAGWLLRKAEKNRAKVEKYAFWGLALFVGVPLPGTGAWTGSLVAAVINLDFWKALLSALLGVLGAGFVMTLLSYGVAAIF